MPDSSAIRAYANCDDAYVVWRPPQAVPECRGFALWRRREGGGEEPVDTWVPWAGAPTPEPGHHEPSTVWPIQKLMWSDFLVRAGDVVSYRAVPMVGRAGALEADEEAATPWSEPITVGPAADPGLSAWFNRGVLATQAMARRLGASEEPWRQQLTEIMASPGNPVRDYLGGELRPALVGLLGSVAADGGTVRAALFELNDPELVEALQELGSRAEVILANGADPDDENVEARTALRERGVQVHDRMTGSRLAHNKFLVRLDAEGNPTAAWTGSTNWSMTGLCTQVNNAVLVQGEGASGVAAFYNAQWEALRDAGSSFPPELVDGNGHPREAALAEPPRRASGWFTPVRDHVDLAGARERIDGAREGILFLAFNPGQSGTLIHDVMAHATPDGTGLYIHGVLNQDPEAGAAEQPEVKLIHRGQLDEANPDILLPAAIDERFASWDEEIRSYNIVMVHSKVIVVDPFGAAPAVITGSHNLGPRASQYNDDNLLIVEGAPRLAAAYAVNIMAIYNAYRWRYVRAQQAGGDEDAWQGLADDADWQDKYFTTPLQRELSFWLGEG